MEMTMFTLTATGNTDIIVTSDETFIQKLARIVTPATALKTCAIGYWGAFWALNGLDKFLNRTDLGLISWYGKDRTNQFTEYFTRLDIPVEAIEPVLFATAIWELAVAAPFFFVIAQVLRGLDNVKTESLLTWGYVLTALTFIGFSGFDVVAGDRAELREHGLYLALLFGCALFTGQAQNQTSAAR
jgi:hypothetical protein